MALFATTQHYEYSVMRTLIVYYFFRFSDRSDFNEMRFTSLKDWHCIYSTFQQSTEVSATISAIYVLVFFSIKIPETIG
jgi:hypothetical protein